MNKELFKGHISMFGANVLWGLMSPVAKLVMSGLVITPLLMTDFRIVGAAVLFWILSTFAPREHVTVPDRFRLAGAAMLGIVLNQGSFIFGVGFTSPGEASIITITMPMWVMILAALILREPITMKKAAGIAFGASGALLLVLGGKTGIAGGEDPLLGDILVLCAQFSYALYLTLYKNFIRRYSLVTLMKWMFLFAAVAVLPFSVSQIIRAPWHLLRTAEIFGIAYVVIGGTFLSYLLVMIGQKALRPTLVGMYNYVQPIVASGIGIALGLDHFTLSKILAVALIFTGVWLVTISKSRASMTEKTAK